MSGGVRTEPAELVCCSDATYGSERAVDADRTWLPERPGRTVALGGTADTRCSDETREPRRAVMFGGSRCDGELPREAREEAAE